MRQLSKILKIPYMLRASLGTWGFVINLTTF